MRFTIRDFYETFGMRNAAGNVRYDKHGKPKELRRVFSRDDVVSSYREMVRQSMLRHGYTEFQAGSLANVEAEDFAENFEVMRIFWKHYLDQR